MLPGLEVVASLFRPWYKYCNKHTYQVGGEQLSCVKDNYSSAVVI